MSYQPFDRNASGIVFFGTNADDQVFESNANFTIDGTTLVATNLKISDGGNIGSASDADAIAIASNGDVTMSQDLIVTGDFTVNGTTTTVNTTNTVVSDSLIELSNGTTTAANDAGFVIERGSTGDNAVFIWDESADKFTMGTTTATGASTGNLTVSAGTLVVATLEGNVTGNLTGDVTGDVTGNADTATALATARDFTLTGQITSDSAVSFDGSANAAIAVSLDKTAITDQTTITSIADGDFVLIADVSDSNNLKKITKGNFVSALGGGTMSSFNITDGSTSQQIDNGEDITFADGTGAEFVVSATNTITVNSVDSEIDHDSLSNFVANEHIDHTSVVLSAGAGLTGGGDISTGRSFAVGAGAGIVVNTNDVAVDINGATDLTAPNVLDELLIADTSDSSNVKKADLASIVNLADHDALTNFVANEHIDHSSVSISAGDGLSGGGTIASTRTLSVDINGATDLTAPAVGDELLISDASDSNAIKKADVASIVNLADHDALTNFVANEHIDHSSVTMTAGNGLTGGGTIASTRTFAVGAGTGITVNANDVQISDGGVDTTQLAADAVTGAKIADDAIDSEHYTDGSIDAAHIASSAVTEVKRSRTVATANSSSTISNDIILATAGAAGITLTLPAAVTGKIVIVKKVDTGAGNVTLDPPGSVTIDGALTKVLYHQYETMTCVSDGTNWFIV